MDKEGNIYIVFNGDRYYQDERYNQGKRDNKCERKRIKSRMNGRNKAKITHNEKIGKMSMDM